MEVEEEEAFETVVDGKERYLEILVFHVITDAVEKFAAKAQLVYLVGRAVSKEVKFKALSVTKQVEAMARKVVEMGSGQCHEEALAARLAEADVHAQAYPPSGHTKGVDLQGG